MRAGSSWRRWRIGRTGPAEFLALTGLGLFMAAIGAFGTDERPILVRNAYWLTGIVGGGVIAAFIEPLLLRVPRLARAPQAFAVVQTLVMTPPITLLVWTISSFMIETGLTLGMFLGLLPSVLIVDIVVVVLAWLIRASTRPRTAPVRPSASPPAIAEKLPPKLARAELLAVEAQDHYLRIHTDAGADLVLMRLADALAALETGEPTRGFRTHRSWWVATEAVETASFRDGRGELTLKGGLRVPVSRSNAETVRRACRG